MPDCQEQEEREPDQDGERDEEAQPCMRLLALAPKPCISASAVVVVGTVDRLRVDGRLVGWRHDASGWLGHPGSLVWLWPAVRPAV